MESSHQSPRTTPSPTESDMFEHPEEHFLSPVHPYEYEDWASDSEGEEENEVEWNAGITDFALFHDDHKRAAQDGNQLDSKWDEFISGQRQALQRALHRSRSEPADPTTVSPPSWSEEVPDLTPDSSPRLTDNIEDEPHLAMRTIAKQQHLDPTRFRRGKGSHPATATSYYNGTDDAIHSDFDDDDEEEDDDMPLEFFIQRRQQQRRDATKGHRTLQRPGLRYSRTMSGRAHSWQRPSWQMYAIREQPEIEGQNERRDVWEAERLTERRRGGRGGA